MNFEKMLAILEIIKKYGCDESHLQEIRQEVNTEYAGVSQKLKDTELDFLRMLMLAEYERREKGLEKLDKITMRICSDIITRINTETKQERGKAET